MTFRRRQFLHLAAGAAALPVVSRSAEAQTYPTRAITIVVPFAAGGPVDVIGRIVAERMRVSLGQPIVIENATGAAGSIGVGRVARAAPDGYIICIGGWPTHVVNGAIYALQYDLLNDFEPIALLVKNPLLMVTKKALPPSNLKELIAWLKANPDKASQGTGGAGSAPHVAGILFQKETGTRFQIVPYRGGGPALQDLLSGQIDIMIDNPASLLPQVRAGTIKAFAVTSNSRLSAAPDTPTVVEAGLPAFQLSSWYALWAPKATRHFVIAKLNAAVVDTLADANVRSRFADIGQEIFPVDQQSPEALAALQKAEIKKWWPIIKAANIKGE